MAVTMMISLGDDHGDNDDSKILVMVEVMIWSQ